MKQTSFSVLESNKKVIDLDSYLITDDLDEISYKILSKFDGDLFQTNIAGNTLEFKTVKDYESDAKNYILLIELQGTDSRIQTLTINLLDNIGITDFFGNNLKLWLDGKDIDGDGTEDASGLDISTWKDKSANLTNDFTSSGNPTQINGGGIDFDGSGDSYKYSGDKAYFDFLSSSADSSLIIVSQIDGGGYYMLLASKSAGNQEWALFSWCKYCW